MRHLTLLPEARELAWPICGPDSRGRYVGREVLQNAANQLRQELPKDLLVDDSRVRDIWWSRLYESKMEMQSRLQRLMDLVRPKGDSDNVLVCHSLLIQRLFKVRHSRQES